MPRTAAGSLLLDILLALRLDLLLDLLLDLILYSLAAVLRPTYVLRATFLRLYLLAALLRRTTAHVVADLVVVEPQALAQAALVHQEPPYGL